MDGGRRRPSPPTTSWCFSLSLLTFLMLLQMPDNVASSSAASSEQEVLEEPPPPPLPPILSPPSSVLTPKPSPSPQSPSEHDESLLLNSDSTPIFLVEPQDSYVVKNRAAVLQCGAAHALKMYFKCNGVGKLDTVESEFVNPHTGVRIVEGEANVTRDMVEEFFGKEKFKCDCHAWSGRGSIKSQPATVEVAYLKKQFEVNPTSKRVEIGQQTELRCVPPVGLPPPRVYWLKGTQPLQSDTAILVSTEGHLLIGQVRLQDTGNYTCIAENIAAKRIAAPAYITVVVNGGWSLWSPWTECHCPSTTTLSTGQKRTRSCTNPAPSNGGEDCHGSSVQRTPDCQLCPQEEIVVDTLYEFNDNDLTFVEPPRWSPWSDWSDCSSNCTKSRRRVCISQPGQPRRCPGKDSHVVPCSSDICPTTQLAGVREANLADTQSDLAVYIGVTVAVFVVTLLSVFLVRIYRKKGQHQSLCNIANNEYHPEFFSDHAGDKKSLTLQPDLTQTACGPCYEYPFAPQQQQQQQQQQQPPQQQQQHQSPQQPLVGAQAPPPSVTRSVSEHHYDVPHLASASDIQMSPATSSTLESSSGKRSQLSGFTNNSDSTYDVATESVTLPLSSLPTAYAITPTTSGNYTSAAVTHSGSHLNLPESAVSLLVPEGAVSRSRKQEIFLSILNEDCFRPKLAENVTQLTPVVSCGPNVSLNKAVVLRLPHCASISKHWTVSVLQSDCSDSQWTTAVTLGQETINTGVFCQMDKDTAYLVTETLSRFVIVGLSSNNGYATKKLKLAVFAPKLCFQSSVDYNIRVYLLEDTDSSIETVFGQEKRLGGFLMDEPKTLFFQDGGSNLCLSIDSISEGWKAKSGSNYQEVPFKHVWKSNSNSLHCSFTVESFEMSRLLKLRLTANQKGSEQYCVFDILCKDDSEVNNRTNSAKMYSEFVPKVTSVQSETSRSSESPKHNKNFDDYVNKCAKNTKVANQDHDLQGRNNAAHGKNLIVTDRGVSTCDDFSFRINKSIRKQVCQCLDTPTSRGNDWRMLCHALSVDRYINFFATKPSPTDCILDLWEARNRQSNALVDLIKILKDMERFDAVAILENSLGPNWL